jgi:LAO/AO transport system kinase
MRLPKKHPKKSLPDLEEWVAAIAGGDTVALGRAITLVESTRPAHRALAKKLLAKCLPLSTQKRRLRVGITGVPGVGKSSFIEALGMQLLDRGHRLAVLAVDPSSRLSKGSILGDKTRMPRLSNSAHAFIRPSPAGSSLGGVARHTHEAIVLCEAAGFDVVFVETVGIGQSETAVFSMTDFFLLLLLPHAGDELQGIKRGVVEMADLIAVNKADGELVASAQMARAAYRNALHLFPARESGCPAQVAVCSAATGLNIAEIWETISDYLRSTLENGYFWQKRESQALYWLEQSIREGLEGRFFADKKVSDMRDEMIKGVRAQRVTPFDAAESLLSAFFRDTHNG